MYGESDMVSRKGASVIRPGILLLCLLNSFWILAGCADSFSVEFLWRVTLYGILGGCLLMACITDCQSCIVYHFVWWVAGVVGLILLTTALHTEGIQQGHFRKSFPIIFDGKLHSLLLFALLQEKLFSRMYGKADCHAFVVCALVQCASGGDLRQYLQHMLLAFGLLAAVQAGRGNIGRNGNLKTPVPFLPYITIAFWVVMVV